MVKDMPQTIVINNRSAIIIGQLPYIREVSKDANGKEKLGKAQLPGDVVTFYPGLNLVDVETLKTLRKNPQFELNFTTVIKPIKAAEAQSELVRAGKPYLVDLKKELPEERPFSKLDAKEVEELVGEMEMLSGPPGSPPRADTLEGLLAQEARETVRVAILNRIAALRPRAA